MVISSWEKTKSALHPLPSGNVSPGGGSREQVWEGAQIAHVCTEAEWVLSLQSFSCIVYETEVTHWSVTASIH